MRRCLAPIWAQNALVAGKRMYAKALKKDDRGSAILKLS